MDCIQTADTGVSRLDLEPKCKTAGCALPSRGEVTDAGPAQSGSLRNRTHKIHQEASWRAAAGKGAEGEGTEGDEEQKGGRIDERTARWSARPSCGRSRASGTARYASGSHPPAAVNTNTYLVPRHERSCSKTQDDRSHRKPTARLQTAWLTTCTRLGTPFPR